MALGKREKANREPYIGVRIRRFRIEKGLTQAQLAEKVSVTDAVISNLETGRSMVGVYTLFDILRVLEIGLDDILPEYIRHSKINDSKYAELDRLLNTYPFEKQKAILNSFAQLMSEINF